MISELHGGNYKIFVHLSKYFVFFSFPTLNRSVVQLIFSTYMYITTLTVLR